MSNRLGQSWNSGKLRSAIAAIVLIGMVPGARVYGSASKELTGETPHSPLSESLLATEFEPPDPEPPDDREGSGSRTSCPAVDKPLTALIPARVNYTISPHPTFWFYVPYPSNPPRDVEFTLMDEEEMEVYSLILPISETPGIVSIRLPDSAPPLEIGQEYLWRFAYRCNPRIRAEDEVVRGAVQRVAPNRALDDRLETAIAPLQRVELYAANRLWHETVTTLAQLQRDNPEDGDIAQEWQELLQSIGLGHLADEAIVECCTPQQ
ncbi:DUF928 domain-containing protein [Phormidium sp. CCY1219]|uniref:DUF928 domain-containing protein n=1 Tax=Phormidium sp. CCY1219 TaxID=2886104 RepID=UPI002D1E5977|nr:DUF928 domain-containing protein [Phormidium sp. CCY1219]MEB3828084.1 DUF928 domain-containing protein [Phormidium sp. CCY1219]